MVFPPKSKVIDLLLSNGFEVIDHQDGSYTVYDSVDPENGWKIVRSRSALAETAKLISKSK